MASRRSPPRERSPRRGDRERPRSDDRPRRPDDRNRSHESSSRRDGDRDEDRRQNREQDRRRDDTRRHDDDARSRRESRDDTRTKPVVESKNAQKPTPTMAASAPAKPAVKQTDPTLDFFSSQFDPLKALSSSTVILPFSAITPLDNLNACFKLLPESLMKKKEEKTTIDEPVAAQEPAPETVPAWSTTTVVERALPERNEASRKPRRPERPKAPMIDQMTESLKLGPLRLLHECMTAGAKVRVIVRRRNTIRTTVTGVLVAFDKHFNLVIKNAAEEQFMQSASPPAAGRAPPPPTRRTRNLKQILIRGQIIVTIARVKT